MNRLIEARLKAGLSQNELARRSGVSQSMITRMEHDEDHPDFRKITGQMAKRLAPALGTTIFKLTGSLDAVAHGMPSKEKERFARMIEAALSEG